MPEDQGQGIGGQSPTIDKAVEREFNALREFLALLETSGPQHPTREEAPPVAEAFEGEREGTGAGAEAPGAPFRQGPEPVIYWWVVLHELPPLPRVAALRERLENLPGAIAAQIVDLSSREIRLGVTTTQQVTLQQLEFAVTACQDIHGAEVTMRVSGQGR